MSNNIDLRPPPPSGPPPPSYAVISRFYRHSLRPVVLGITAVGALYAALWGGSAFHDISGDRRISHTLGTYDILIGAFYVGVLAVEAIGFFGAAVERAPLVRMYTILSVVASLLVMAAELMRTVLHFKYKSTILSTCLTDVTTTGVTCYGFFCRSKPLSQSDGQQWCKDWFNRRSVSDIIWFIASAILSVIFSSIAFGYCHQLVSVGERIVAPQHLPLNDFRTSESYHYDPPNYPQPAFPSAQNTYAPSYDGSKVPEYEGTGLGSEDKAPGYEYAYSEEPPKVNDGTRPTVEGHEDGGYHDGSNPFENR